MSRIHIVCMAFLCAATFLTAQDNGKPAAGIKPGNIIPGSFEAFNVNGPAKGRPHCLVCQFGLDPTVLIFTKEPAEGKDDALNELIKKLDETAKDFEERNFSAGVIVISPDGQDSTTNANENDARKLIDEAVKRDKLTKRLEKRAESLKDVIIAFVAEAPKKYDLKADVTVLYYERMKVINNWEFADGMKMEDVDAIVKRVRDTLPAKKKK